MHFVLLGDPTPLSRCRFVTKDVIDKQREVKIHARRTIESQFDSLGLQPFTNVPLDVAMTFYMELPKKETKRKAYKQIHYHRWTPSLQQLLRLILDVSQGIVFTSDATIARLTVDKLFDETPRTEIEIKELKR